MQSSDTGESAPVEPQSAIVPLSGCRSRRHTRRRSGRPELLACSPFLRSPAPFRRAARLGCAGVAGVTSIQSPSSNQMRGRSRRHCGRSNRRRRRAPFQERTLRSSRTTDIFRLAHPDLGTNPLRSCPVIQSGCRDRCRRRCRSVPAPSMGTRGVPRRIATHW